MAQPSILFEARAGVAWITLNRPEVLNAFDTAMSRALQERLAEVARDDAVRAVVLTGAGRAFCAGQDLAEATGGTLTDFAAHVRTVYNPLVLALRGLPRPVVCAVNGVAAGAGANLALACDLVVASETASFVQAFVNIGLIPDTGGSWLLPRLVGGAQAAALTMLGDKIAARRAHELGMIYQVVPAAELATTVSALATRLAGQPTYALALTKRLLQASATNPLERQLELEAETQKLAGGSADYAEGVAAFLAKRKPVFTGR
jgi:2-(1,2-epoxy-1,2-dihydrophenyl)acetyl-CoA isomerase